MRENLKPILDQIKVTLGNRDQIRELVEKNISQARTTLEAKAKEVVEKTKDSSLMTDVVRPAIESEKAELALNRIETRLVQAAPLVAKLREYRRQFLDATRPADVAEEKAPDEKPAKKKKSTKQPEA